MPQILDGAAAAAAVIAQGFADFPWLLVDGLADVGESGCPLGGTAARICNELGVPRQITATFDNCAIPSPSGSIVIDGAATMTTLIGVCPNALVPPIDEVVSLRLQYLDSEGAMQRAVSVELSADVTDLRGLDSPCFFTGITAVASGTIQTQVAGGAGVDAALDETEIVADVTTYSEDCLALASTQTFDGNATFTDFPGARTFPIDFRTLELMRVASAFGFDLALAGEIGGPCFGGGAMLSTAAVLQLPLGDMCPAGGILLIDTTFAPQHTLFYGESGVAVDEDGDDEADVEYPSCTAAPACG